MDDNYKVSLLKKKNKILVELQVDYALIIKCQFPQLPLQNLYSRYISNKKFPNLTKLISQKWFSLTVVFRKCTRQNQNTDHTIFSFLWVFYDYNCIVNPRRMYIYTPTKCL